MLAWAGVRRPVPVILAALALIAGVQRAIELLNLVFCAVLLSAALERATVSPGASPRAQGSDEQLLFPSPAT